MNKKLLVILLTLLTALSLCLGLSACGGSNTPRKEEWSGDFKFEYNQKTNTYIISAAHAHSLSGELEIPESFNERPVTVIDDHAFSSCKELTSVTIPDSVITIGSSAFSGCTGLKSVVIGRGVTKIKNDAFQSCTEIEKVTWNAENCTVAGHYIFMYCENLKTVTFGETVKVIPSYLFSNCGGLTGELKIPDSVISIGAWAFQGFSGLTGELKIPDGVTSIGNYAFAGCSGLTGVVKIPNGVISIGDCAFEDCSGLTGVAIPDSVTSMGLCAFRGCSGLISVVIPDSLTSIDTYAFDGCINIETATMPACAISSVPKRSLKTVTITSGESIIGGAFQYCDNLESVTLPESITFIGNSAFLECKKLTGELKISDKVTSIGDRAYYQCGLTSVTIGSGVTEIGQEAFACDSLEKIDVRDGNTAFSSQDGILYNKDKTQFVHIPNKIKGEVTIPNGVTEIGRSAFAGSKGLTSITIPDSVTSIGDYAFANCLGMTSATIGSGVASIGWNVFDNCTNIETAIVSEKILYQIPKKSLKMVVITGGERIYSEEFYECTELESIIIPNGIVSIGDDAFKGCIGLKSIEIPASVTSMGKTVFLGCSGLKEVVWNAENCQGSLNTFEECMNLESVTFGETVKTIPAALFSGCYRLTNVEIPNGVISIGRDAFSGCRALMSITLPDSLTSIGMDAFEDTGFYYISDNWDESGMLYLGKYLIAAKTTISGDLEIREDTKLIAGGAFFDCAKLTSIKIPYGMTSIEESTFSRCSSLVNIIIPDSVTSIGDYAFADCSGLKSIEIPDGVTLVGRYSFYCCSGLTSIEIPESVSSIGEYAFYRCAGLTSITIPKSMTSIGSRAFYNCNSLQTVYYAGTDTDWGNIEIDGGNDRLKTANRQNPVLQEYKKAIEDSLAAQSYRVVLSADNVQTTIDQKIDYVNNIRYSKVKIGGTSVNLYHAVEDGKVYVYSGQSGSWLRAALEADPETFLHAQDGLSAFKTEWDRLGESGIQYDSTAKGYKLGNYVFTIKDGYIATLKNTQTNVEYVFSEYGAVDLTLPALGQVDESAKAAFVVAMKNTINATNFHHEFKIVSDGSEMIFSTDVNAGTAALSTGYIYFNGNNYPVMQVYREYANGTLTFSQRQADLSSGMPSLNPKWGTWMSQQGPAPETVRQNDLYVCHPAFMLTGGRSDDASLELMYILSSRDASGAYTFLSYDLNTMQSTQCKFEIAEGYISKVTIMMREWLQSLGAEGDSLTIEYSKFNETTLTRPEVKAVTSLAALPWGRKEQ